MRKSLPLLISLFISLPCFAGTKDVNIIGKILTSTGTIKKTNINCEKESCDDRKYGIYSGERIITGENSKINIILKDGTAIILYSNSDILIDQVRLRDRDKPTIINFESGKIKIIQKNNYLDTSLLIKTTVAIIKSVNSELSVVTSENETALFVYNGEAGFANINSSVVEAFLLNEGDESFISKDTPPARPVKVKKILRSSWISRHFITADKKRILKYDRKSGIADWPFINNE